MEKSITFAQLEHLHSKYVGTGDSNTSRLEWLNGVHRDTYAAILGHTNVQLYMACAEGESVARTRYNLLHSMIAPCNPNSMGKYAAGQASASASDGRLAVSEKKC